jgi:hypothetical protein
MGQVHNLNVRRLSDAELLQTDFRVQDPERLPGLNLGVPDPEAHPIIIGYYDETPPGGRAGNPNVPFIRCCHCGLRRHWRGYLVRDDQEQLYIIGARQCGREHYGARFEAAEQMFKQEQARKRALSRWQNMSRLVDPIASEVTALLTSDTLRALERKRDEIERASPAGFAALVRESGSGNPLFEVREERDYGAEAKRKTRYEQLRRDFEAKPREERARLRREGRAPELETHPILRRISEPLGPLMGAGFLTPAGDARSAALALRTTLDSISRIEAIGSDAATLTEMTRLLREMTDRPRLLRDAVRELVFADLFFRPDNLERIERWSTASAYFSYQAEGDHLHVQDSHRGAKIIFPLPPGDLPALPTIDSLEFSTEEFQPVLVAAA